MNPTPNSLFGDGNNRLYIDFLSLVRNLRHVMYISGIHLTNTKVWNLTTVRKTLCATQEDGGMARDSLCGSQHSV